MQNLFNKNSTGFLLRFALIMTLSFSVFFAVDYFDIGAQHSSVPAAVGEE